MTTKPSVTVFDRYGRVAQGDPQYPSVKGSYVNRGSQRD